MSDCLRAEDFPAFFEALSAKRDDTNQSWSSHGPFPWQTRLAEQVVGDGRWPSLLDLPTGAGKTAVIDIAVYHLALEAERTDRPRQASMRILFVVDRRLVVDAAYDRARKIAALLRAAAEGTLAKDHPEAWVLPKAAKALKRLAGDGADPLVAARLRGGMPQENDWAQTAHQPTVLVSTVDQVGSRLLFRGYGVTDRMAPVHAGLVGSDALWLLDEVHLSNPFRQTLEAIQTCQDHWFTEPRQAPFGMVQLSATPGMASEAKLSLDESDCNHPVLSRRLSAAKPSEIKVLGGLEAARFAEEAKKILQIGGARSVAVVVNRVQRARDIFKVLEGYWPDTDETQDRPMLRLMIGRSRPLDRERWERQLVKAVGTGSEATAPIIVVATQTIEAGADLDFDALVTEAAPLDALRQRFGRVNRAGRDRDPTSSIGRGVILIDDKLTKGKGLPDDPVYGTARAATARWLQNQGAEIDFGIKAMEERLAAVEPPLFETLLSPRRNAPWLLPPYLDLWSMTWPRPDADPEPALFLHGEADSAEVQIVWRADLELTGRLDDNDATRLLRLCPPSTLEAVQIPLWVAKGWLAGEMAAADPSDVPTPSWSDMDDHGKPARRAIRWRNNEAELVGPEDLGAGDILVVPSSYGGADAWGWNPSSGLPVWDLGSLAHLRHRRRFALRVHKSPTPGPSDPGLVGSWGAVAAVLEAAEDMTTAELVTGVLNAILPSSEETERETLTDIIGKLRPSRHDYVEGDPVAGTMIVGGLRCSDEDANTLARGLRWTLDEDRAKDMNESEPAGDEPITDTDRGNTSNKPILLDVHLRQVADAAEKAARAAGLADGETRALILAARFHDLGKADLRFQAMLYGGGLVPLDAPPLAKGVGDRSRHLPDYPPKGFRHEAVSVALAQRHPAVAALAEADQDLVLWLIGTHHGYGRPFFPTGDDASVPLYLPVETRADGELAAEADAVPLRLDRGWCDRRDRLLRRYGPWELARMEALLRLVDHRVSERPAKDLMAFGTVSRSSVATRAIDAVAPTDHVLPLPGLEPDNLLATLALLGLLRSLQAERSDWRPRISWTGVSQTAVLHVLEDVTEEEVAAAADAGVRKLGRAYVFDKKDLAYTQSEFRNLVSDAKDDWVRLQLLAVLACDVVRPGKSDESVEISPFCFIFGQGHQHFLTRLALHALSAQDKDAKRIHEALFQPWPYERGEDRVGFRWDPAEARRYALQEGDPSDKKRYGVKTSEGANRLATLGLLSMPVVPMRPRACAAGVDRRTRDLEFVWPVPNVPLSLASLDALLAYPSRMADVMGGNAETLRAVAKARRFSAGKFSNVEKARLQRL